VSAWKLGSTYNFIEVIIVFVDAPHILLPSELTGASSRSDSGQVVSEEAPDPSTIPRGWWQYNEAKAEGLKTSILVIRGLLMAQKFDVRAILATALTI
jgi:hypothetical protein